MEGCFHETVLYQAENEVTRCLSHHTDPVSVHSLCVCKRNGYQSRKRRLPACEGQDGRVGGEETVVELGWNEYLAGDTCAGDAGGL